MLLQRYFVFVIITVTFTCLTQLIHPGLSFAAITGMCSDCHTMHNSQDNKPMTLDDGETPNAGLLKTTCFGCHAQGGSSSTVMMGSNKVPQVYHTGPTNLAGGNFAYITGAVGSGGANNKGHNITGLTIGGADATLDGADATLDGPPGFIHSDFFVNTNTLSCASWRAGCHGVRHATQSIVPIIGISGSHHKNKSGQLVKSPSANFLWPYESYRFLSNVQGLESADWEENVTAENHNEYFATSSPLQLDCATRCHTTAGMVISRSGTISGFCATCHSKFHTLAYEGTDKIDATEGVGSTSPWLRHPTDVSLPATPEYAAYTEYDPNAPVGRLTVPATSSSVVTPGSDAVTCLSCHVAHASDYPDMLRWDYSEIMFAGGGGSGGCFTCHSTKN